MVLAFWLVAAVYYVLAFGRRPSSGTAARIAAAAALAVLTKSTAYIFLPPVALAAWLTWPRPVKTALLARLPWMAILVAALAAPHSLRMYAYSGSPIGSATSDEAGVWRFANDRFSPAVTASNLVRNTALHLATRNAEANAILERWSNRLIAALGADPNDPATTWAGERFAIVDRGWNEDGAANTLHLLLFAGVLAAMLFRGRNRNPETLALAVGLAAGYVLFCGYLRWQPWHTRLHLPLFILASPVAAAVFAGFRTWGAGAAADLTLLAGSGPALLRQEHRPLLAINSSILFRTRAELEFTPPGHYLAGMLAKGMHCRDVGIDASFGFVEYPLLAALEPGPLRRVWQIARRTKSRLCSPRRNRA
jgi:hypothetical protein